MKEQLNWEASLWTSMLTDTGKQHSQSSAHFLWVYFLWDFGVFFSPLKAVAYPVFSYLIKTRLLWELNGINVHVWFLAMRMMLLFCSLRVGFSYRIRFSILNCNLNWVFHSFILLQWYFFLFFFKNTLPFFFGMMTGPVLRTMPILQIMNAICCRLANSCIHNLAF